MWPTEQELRDRLRALLGGLTAPRSPHVGEWQHAGYRFAPRAFATLDHFTSGEGARLAGGRFTPRGGPRTVYLAADIQTAAAEVAYYHTLFGVPDTAFRPRVLAAVAVSVGAVLDLTAPAARADLGLPDDALATDWRVESERGGVAPTQLLGRLVWEVGFEGLVAPSVRRPEGTNVVLFPDNFGPHSHAVMIDLP